MYLIGTVMFVFGTGLYELFISNMDIAKQSHDRSSLFGLFKLPVGLLSVIIEVMWLIQCSYISDSVGRNGPSGWKSAR